MPKKILFLHSSSDLYGASRIFLQTILCLKEQHIEPIVVLSSAGPLSEELQKRGVTVMYTRLGVLRRKYMSFAGLINRAYYTLAAVIFLRRVIHRESIDLVYNNASSIVSGLLAAKSCRIPHLWHVHEIIMSPRWFARGVAHLLQYSTHVLVVSEATRDHWVSIAPKLKEKISVIYNGLSHDYLSGIGSSKLVDIKRNYEDYLWVGMIARVHFWKGQSYFLDLAEKISAKHDKVRFVMAGDAFPGYEYLYDELAEKTRALGLEEKVIDLGLVQDSRDFYPLIDMMILPSILPDPLPTTCLEAMAHGIPVVATNHGGATEMIEDGKTGMLIPVGDSAKAYQKIAPLMEDRELQKQYGTAGKARLADLFTIERYNSELSTLVFSMMGGNA